ncbi:putative phosphoenolpyruvate synthase-like protein [Leptotrombidium deliense]|uniref:Putative phosphoenolpyruvate synthase-like protein n=1 Tax=Leptotrombidium deliense TaxID=299467 RepID=A0A443SJK3_9ACAR|nr:putative phosphoenolpyruvate synthase-like protein [Leptotrombidium deliense]
MLRYLLTKRNLDSIQKANRERIEFYDYSSSDPYISGFIASEREWNLEKPDYGPEVNGKVFVKILLTLKVTEKKVYSIEEQYLTPVSEMKKTEYRTGALSIEILSPFRRMRLHFRGILKNEETGETVFVHFRFHWYALSNVFDHKCSFNSNFIAQQLIDNKSKETKVENRFEQFGNIKGTLKFGKGKEEQIFLWGWRSKSFCKKELSASRLLLVAKNGIAISVGSVSNKKHQYKYSYGLVTNNKGIDGVTDITTKKNVIEKISLKAFEFQVSTGSNMYAVSVGRDNKKFIRDAVINQVEAKCVCFYDTFHITVDSSIMYNELSFAYQSEYTSKATNDLVIPLSDKHATSVQLSGGKGSSLAILSRMTSLSRITPRFQVPKGIVVTSNAFNSFLEKNNQVLRRIDLLEKLAWYVEG